MSATASAIESPIASTSRSESTIALLLGFIAVAGFLFLRALYVQYPVVFADEELYALHAKYLYDPRFAVLMPNVFYFLVYHPASWFGASHLTIAKLFNAAFFGLALFPLYAIAAKFLSKTGAYVFSVFVLFSPVTSYSVYVMPEAMFFLVFWTLVYLVVVKLPSNLIRGGVYFGFTIAVLSTIKPHGLILFGALPVALAVLRQDSRDQISWSMLVKTAAGSMLAFIVGRFGIEYLACRDFAISLLGIIYSSAFSPPAGSTSWILWGFWHLLRGHLASLGILFWPALLVVAWPSQTSNERQRETVSFGLLRGFSFAALGLILAMVVKASLDFTMLNEVQLCHLHGRYYDFLLPALVLLFLARTRRNTCPRHATLFRIILIGGACVACALAYYALPTYCVNFVDFPDIRWIAMSTGHLALAMAGCIITAIALAFFKWNIARLVYCASLIMLGLMSSSQVFSDQILAISGPPSADLAAIAVRNLLGSNVDDGVVVAKPEDDHSYRALFQLYSLSQRLIIDRDTLTQSDLPKGVKWALLLDRYRVDIPYYARMRERDFDLILLSPIAVLASHGSVMESYPRFYSLSKDGQRPVFTNGFDLPENGATWTREPTARVYLDAPISGSVEIAIKAHAYGPNVGRPIRIKVGNIDTRCRFFWPDNEVKIIGNLTSPADYIEFSGMLGVSPAQFEHSNDTRPLGIGVSTIQINRIATPGASNPEPSRFSTEVPDF
jgi:phosphoglycerol transferase